MCFDIMRNFLIMTHFWLDDKHLAIFDVMTNLLALWQTFSRDDVFLVSWWTSNDEPFVLMTCFWHYGEPFWHQVKQIDVIKYFLTSWRIFWCGHKRFEIMTCLWHHDEFLGDQLLTSSRKQHFWCHDTLFWRHELHCVLFTSWRAFCGHDVFLTSRLTRPDYFLIISGTKYYENVFLMSLTSLYFWLHDKLLTSWQTFWRHDMF